MNGTPYLIWAALLGSGLTLIGVLLSNWSSGKQLRKQLTHDSQEKQKDRILSLRKEVYLNATEQLAKVNSHLGRLPKLDPTKHDLDAELSEFVAASSKLRLVCQPATAAVADELTTMYGEIFVRLLAKAYPIQNINTDIRICTDFYERCNAEAERTLAEMKHQNETGRPDPVHFAALQTSCQSAQQDAKRYAEERSGLYGQHKVALRKYTIAMLTEVRAVAALQVDLTAAVRAELDLETDVAELKTKLKANLERMDKSIQGLLASLDGG
jgi:hypothetical protein